MSLNIQKYQRKPFVIEAIQVTLDNMEDVAKWCGGELIIDQHNGKLTSYIKVDVDHAISERQKKAFVDDWVLKNPNKIFKCYSRRAFPNNFEPIKTRVTPDELAEAFDQNLQGYPVQEPLFRPVSESFVE